MTMHSVLETFQAASSPLLPHPSTTLWALYLSWAMLLGSISLGLSKALGLRRRLGLASVVMAWTLIPGTTSPAYWLGLAFQTPSLSTCAISLVYLIRTGRPTVAPGHVLERSAVTLRLALSCTAVLLGWLLLLDTLAALPVSVYAWGFSAAACAGVAALVVLLWASLSAASRHSMPWGLEAALITTVLSLFVWTRLPTGNVWDAVLDPWLWIALHWYAIKQWSRRRSADAPHQPLAPK